MKADISVQADDGQASFPDVAQPGAHPVASLHQLYPKRNPAAAAPAVAPKPARIARPRWIRMLARRRLEGVLGLTSLVMMIVCWYLLTHFQVSLYVRFANIPSPGDVLNKFIEINRTTAYASNVAISLRRIMLGFGGAAISGIALGLLIGRYRYFRALLFPALEVLRPIPAIAWVPISVMLWPSNEVSIVFITFLGAFFPILLNTVAGVQAIDDVLIRAASTLGASEKAMFRYVILPGALPHIFSGLALGMGVAWVSLIAAEMISGQFGIGYATWEAYSLISYPEIVVGMVTIGILGWVCSGLIRLVGSASMPWLAFATRRGK
ncbi:MAG: sulfonate transport system permease protein [Paraburkholderia sp.]|jgi:NitT/TauT family transport system permease protein|nr:sulfonate transport system permease protein [Paraburkholderia sp.]